MDVTLVNVSTPLPRDEDDAREVYLPLGSLYLVSALERAGVSVDFRDYQLFVVGRPTPLDVELFQSFLADHASIVAVSCMVSMLPFVVLGTGRFKERNPDCTLILGGPGPSGVADEIISSFPWVDIVGIGEGEETIVELVRALRTGGDLNSVRGIAYRDGRIARRTPPRPRIKNPDAVAFPAYDRLDLSRYTCVPIVTGRGCPFRCAFCDVGPLWGNRTCFRSVENVVEELTLLRDAHALETVHIADDTFNLKRSRVEALCGELKRLGMGWTCLSRVDMLDEALLERMADAGCRSLFLGIESGSDAVLTRINKRFSIEEATRTAELAARYVKQVVTSFIWGFPFETMWDFKQTVFSVISMSYLNARAGLKLLSPMPLSPLGVEYRDRLAFSAQRRGEPSCPASYRRSSKPTRTFSWDSTTSSTRGCSRRRHILRKCRRSSVYAPSRRAATAGTSP
jgi:anaerobic magnesium-protoporphyrin IX monomethyl ester cyclase